MAAVRWGMVVGFLVLSIGCANADRPTGPGQVATPSTSTTAPPLAVQPRVFPPLSGPPSTYAFSGQLDYAVSQFTVASKYALYDNGAFSLHFLTGEITGAYQRDNDRISFHFVGGGDATGTLNGDVLEVRYGERMQHSDFENAVYRRSR